MRVFRVALAVVLLLTVVGAASTAQASHRCPAVTWGSLPKAASVVTSDTHVVGVRAGRQSCFDRLVVDLDGSTTGYRVEYVPELTAEGSGEAVPVEGGAIIRIITRAPAYDDHGEATVSPAAVDGVAVGGFPTFRDVALAGSFEGQTTIGLGVRARLPFRVFTLDGPGDGSRLVVDVANTWTPSTATVEQPKPGLPGEAIDPPVGRGDRVAVMGVASDDVLNVRARPGTDHPTVTTAGPTNVDVVATGRARRLSRSIWYEVTVDGATGWANSRFLGILGSTNDVTSGFPGGESELAATTMTELGAKVAAEFASTDPPSMVVVSVAPTVGDLGEITYDVIGLGDDAVAGIRLHVFATPHDSGDGFVLRTVEATEFCARGFDGTACV